MVSRLKNCLILEDLQLVPAGYDFYHFLSMFSYCKHFISIGWIIVPVNITTTRLSRGRPGGGSTFAGVPKGIYGRVSHFGGLSRFLASGTKKGQHREKRTWNVGLKLKNSFDLHLDAQHWASKWMLGRLKLLFTNLSLQLKNFVGVLCDGFEFWDSASPPNGQRPKVIKEIWPNGRKKTEVINAPQSRRDRRDHYTPKRRSFSTLKTDHFFQRVGWNMIFQISGARPQGSSVFGWWLRVSVSRKRNGPLKWGEMGGWWVPGMGGLMSTASDWGVMPVGIYKSNHIYIILIHPCLYMICIFLYTRIYIYIYRLL